MSVAPSDAPSTNGPWTTEEASQVYNVEGWGGGYFSVGSDGTIAVSPSRNSSRAISIQRVIEEALEAGLHLPLLVRFQDILRDRVQRLNMAFADAKQEAGYEGAYRGVFPIKVNHLREVVEEITDAGAPYHFGLEVGSKPELFAALAMHSDPESLIICNGYKDSLYISTALTGVKLGKRVIMVVEKPEELEDIIAVSQQLDVKPFIGVRIRLQAKGMGRWATSGGDDAKFGLTTGEMLHAARRLEEVGLGSQLKLLHFHIGSQIPDIQIIKRAIREASRYYAKLRKLGFEVEYLDAGGGLAIDYEGTRSTSDSSMNYSLEEYARDIVYNVLEVCQEEDVPQPNLVTESGRAIVAHHSVLIVDVLGVIDKRCGEKPGVATEKADENQATALGEDLNADEASQRIIKDLNWLIETLNEENRREYFHDALSLREDAETRFDYGLLGLHAKAEIERLYWKLLKAISALYPTRADMPDEISELVPSLSEQFLCNFSVFQSMVDHWAVGQLFPVLPLTRLNEEPANLGTLVDITCDSDGKLCKFIGERAEGLRDTLPLHRPQADKPYYLGVFLMGAYQDIMGDLHNLFGSVNEAHVFLDAEEEDGFYIEETISGSTIAQVLDDVQYNRQMLTRALKRQVDQAIRDNRLRPNEAVRLQKNYERGLDSTTYLSRERKA